MEFGGIKMKELRLDRGSLEITMRCTLKCKLCAAYAPYYDVPPHYSAEYCAQILEKYFQIVDYVGDFSLSGGEALMHKEIDKIIDSTFKYQNQFSRFLILTNGTLLFKKSTIELLKKYSQKKNVQINISDYGKVSCKVKELVQQLTDAGIKYRVINYHGDDVWCGGWIDYGDHTQKIFTLEERDEAGANCVFGSLHSSLIHGGEIHRCGRAQYRMEKGIIPRNKAEYVDLFDDTLTIEEKKEILRYVILEAKSTESCAHCNSMTSESERFPAAEQLP